MTEDDLLAAILAAPDDDGPRLVYADWLQEQGDLRGEFIETAILAETLPDGDPRRDACRDRLNAMWRDEGERWAATLGSQITWKRGLVGWLGMERRHAQAGAAILRGTCLRDLQLNEPFGADDVTRLVAMLPHMRLTKLFTGFGVARDEIRRLLASPALAGLRIADVFVEGGADAIVEAAVRLPLLEELVVRGGGPSDAAAHAIATSATLSAVFLDYGGITWTGAAAMLRAPSLRSLRLRRHALAAGIEAFLAAPGLERLETLGLAANALDADAIRAIVHAPALAGLPELSLADIPLPAASPAAVDPSPFLRQRLTLELDGGSLGLEADIWYDQGFAIGSSWKGEPAPDLAARFHVVVTGAPNY